MYNDKTEGDRLPSAIGKLCCASFPLSLSFHKWWQVMKLYLLPGHPDLHANCIVTGYGLPEDTTGKGVYLEVYSKMIKSSSLSSTFLDLLWQLHLEMWCQGMSHLEGQANWQLCLGCWHWDLHFTFSPKQLLSSLCQPLSLFYIWELRCPSFLVSDSPVHLGDSVFKFLWLSCCYP